MYGIIAFVLQSTLNSVSKVSSVSSVSRLSSVNSVNSVKNVNRVNSVHGTSLMVYLDSVNNQILQLQTLKYLICNMEKVFVNKSFINYIFQNMPF